MAILYFSLIEFSWIWSSKLSRWKFINKIITINYNSLNIDRKTVNIKNQGRPVICFCYSVFHEHPRNAKGWQQDTNYYEERIFPSVFSAFTWSLQGFHNLYEKNITFLVNYSIMCRKFWLDRKHNRVHLHPIGIALANILSSHIQGPSGGITIYKYLCIFYPKISRSDLKAYC